MRTLQTVFVTLTTFGLVSIGNAAAKKPQTLKFTGSDWVSKTFRNDDLTKKLKEKTLTVDSHPAYGGSKKIYRGYDIFEFLKMADPKLDPKTDFSILVTTEDGWKAPPYTADLLRTGHALLAIAETSESLKKPIPDDGLWSLVVTPERNIHPGPFYLVWNVSGENPDTMPFQVVTMKVSKEKPKK